MIEDAAHAIGSSWQGKRIGSFGDIVSFSFHPNKNMTTIEGGALSFADAEEVKKFDLLRFHGISRDADGNMDVSVAGGKYNLTDVAARVGLGQLPQLDGFNAKRRELVTHYFQHFATDPACLLPARGDEGHSWHMFAPLLPLDQLNISREQFIDAMHQRGLGVGIHYPALHLFSLYRELGLQGRRLPQRRTHRPRNRHPAAVPDDGTRRCGAGMRRSQGNHRERQKRPVAGTPPGKSMVYNIINTIHIMELAMRTNIVIDDESDAKRLRLLSGLRTKREIVEASLQPAGANQAAGANSPSTRQIEMGRQSRYFGGLDS